MAATVGNAFSDVPDSLTDEQVLELLASPTIRIERIVSTGQSSPPGFWYDQDWLEWVILLSGSAGLLFDGESETRVLRPGDYIQIPAHRRHRVEWTDPNQATVWLAIHIR